MAGNKENRTITSEEYTSPPDLRRINLLSMPLSREVNGDECLQKKNKRGKMMVRFRLSLDDKNAGD